MAKILPIEPDPGTQICGYEITVGRTTSEYCGELKTPGLYFCQEHHQRVLDEYGEVHMAPGNAVGLVFDPNESTLTRPVPFYSGEGAIYTPEYLHRREGNAHGTDAHRWRTFPTNG
ncbi:hypothetical protein ACIOHE_26485 [Streptomyces sp. NPDC087851]|uniref:hypothetical protein n=1 Tax=Streptomyces sp. NPDC087851 TaxID=3365810 RepID=UPI0037F1EA50